MEKFPYKTTTYIRELITNTQSEAISRQFDIDPREYDNNKNIEFELDPVNDMLYYIGDGIIKKYQNRILLITTGTCAVNCRYCFRRNFDYALSIDTDNFDLLVEKINTFTAVDEVILSGGDPLTLSNDILKKLFTSLQRCPHITKIRIHSRLLTVSPNRINDSLLSIFTACPQKIIFVSHINHSDELTDASRIAAKKLLASDVLLLNQSVLLKGINDSETILSLLSNQLFDAGILPYYLNLFDKVKGGEHFFLSIEKSKEIYQRLSENVSGYLLPKLVYDDGGTLSKIIVGTIK